MISFNLNGANVSVKIPDDVPLIWVLREEFNLNATKYGCGVGGCGNCIVQINGKAVQSCLVPISAVAGKSVTTLEGVRENPRYQPIFKAWIENNVADCGYCQPGQIMQAIDLLLQQPNPTEDQLNAAMSRVICRCGTYQRIKKAILDVIAGGGLTNG